MELGKKIRQLRDEKGIEQLELANKVGISQSKMNKIETGYQKRIEPEILNDIAKALQVKVDTLLNNEHETNNDSFDPLKEINQLLKKYNIDQSGFFDIEKWKTMGPEGIKQLESYFQFIVEQAERTKEEEKNSNEDSFKK